MRVVDLFAGLGGLSLGFERAGYEIVGSFDNWPAAQKAYLMNRPHHNYILMDLSDVDLAIERIGELNPDIVIGGPPCQDFSTAGRRNYTGERAKLTGIYSSIIESIRPKLFLMENVPSITKSPLFNEAIDRFRNAGYGLTIIQLDASYYEVPQARKRLFVIGILNGPDDLFREPLLRRKQSKQTTVRSLFGQNEPPFKHFISKCCFIKTGICIQSIDRPSKTIVANYRPLPSNYIYKPGKDSADPRQEYVHFLTPDECKLIQSFPADWQLGTDKKLTAYKLVGNAVPPKLAEHIGLAIKEGLASL